MAKHPPHLHSIILWKKGTNIKRSTYLPCKSAASYPYVASSIILGSSMSLSYQTEPTQT